MAVGVALAGTLLAVFAIRQDGREEAAARVSDPEEADARLAECREGSRL